MQWDEGEYRRYELEMEERARELERGVEPKFLKCKLCGVYQKYEDIDPPQQGFSELLSDKDREYLQGLHIVA